MTIYKVLLFIALVSISGCSESEWPPLPRQDASVLATANYELKIGGGEGEGWGKAYVDRTMKEELGWGFIGSSGDVLLGRNLFNISRAGDGYSENQYEVVYYDDDQTLIRMVKAKGDRLLMLKGAFGPDGINMSNTALLAGARVRYVDRTYELRRDGWYLDERLVHEFPN